MAEIDIVIAKQQSDVPALESDTLVFTGESLIEGGTQTIATGDWSGTTATKTITGLTNNDMLKIAPVSKTDAANWAAANIWVTHSGATLTFAADTAPTAAINVVYEIAKGVL